jgi:hypothetical protein
MKIETTVTGMKDGICVFEQDVIVSVVYDVDRDNELTWSVDEYIIEGPKRVWDDTAQKWTYPVIAVSAPECLAKVFDEYLDKEALEEELIERLIDMREMRQDDYADARADYNARVL